MVIVKMGLARLSKPAKVVFTRSLVTQATGNPNFVSPTPTLTAMASGANVFEAAMLAARSGGPDERAVARAKEELLDSLLRQFFSYVQLTANANPAAAEAIVLSAGLQVKSKGVRNVPTFYVKLTGNPGEVEAFQKGTGHCTFEFQICTDLTNEANWVTFEVGTRGRVVKGGLAPNTRYYFRARVIDKNGRSGWSDVRSVFVME